MDKDGLWLAAINEKNFTLYDALLPELYRDSFMNTPRIQGMGANLKNQAVGIILFTEDPVLPFCRVLYMAVSKEYRQRGIATYMLLETAKAAYKAGLYTTAKFFASEEDHAALSVFEDSGEFSILETENGLFSVSKKDVAKALEKMDEHLHHHKAHLGIRLSDCKSYQMNQIEADIAIAGFNPFASMQRADHELSMIYPDKNGVPKAVILVEDLYDGNGYLITCGLERDNPVALMKLISQVFSGIYENMGDDDRVEITSVGEIVPDLAKMLNVDLKTESRLYTVAYNGDDPM